MQTFNNPMVSSTPISEIGVNLIRNLFKGVPSFVKMQIRVDNGSLNVKLGFWYGKDINTIITLNVDKELCMVVAEAMSGKMNELVKYTPNKHFTAAVNTNELDNLYISIIFHLSNIFNLMIGEKYISPSGKQYEHITFAPSLNSVIEIYAPVSESVSTAIDNILKKETSEHYLLNKPACSTDDNSVYNGMDDICNL